MRGEKDSICHLGCIEGGSSPHARGKVGEHKTRLPVTRIIPACAGKRLCRHGELLTEVMIYDEDHPRMRGEKSMAPF